MGILQIPTSVSVLQRGIIGYQAVSFSGLGELSESAPTILAGSAIEISSAYFECTSDTAINATSWASITTGNNCFVYLEPSGSVGNQIITAYYTESAPIWSTSKQGWYASAASTNRYVMVLKKDSSTHYRNKIVLKPFIQDNLVIDTNTRYGFGAMNRFPTVGYNTSNTAIGYQSLYYITILGANYNTAIGYQSLYENGGTRNTAIGYQSLYDNSGNNNVAIGFQALYDNSGGGFNNVAIGNQSLYSNDGGIGNIGIGYQTLYSSIDITGLNAIGYQSLYSNTSGTNLVAIGYQSLYSNINGKENTAIGNGSLYSNTTGTSNTAIGYQSLYSNISGSYLVAIGRRSLYNNIGTGNTAIGFESLYSNTTGISNTAIGTNSMGTNTTGNFNTAIGRASLVLNTVGTGNTAIGYASLYNNKNGFANTAIGFQALYNITSGYGNTAIGHNSLYSSISTTVSNTAIGANSLYGNTSGENNIGIGVNAEGPTSTSSSIITLGNNNHTILRCNVTTITSLSDKRDKTNIKDLSLGIDFINLLKPVEFNWDRREWYAKKDKNGIILRNKNNDYVYEKKPDGSKIGKKDYGFIAQDFEKVQKDYNLEWLDLVLKDNPKRLETSNGKLLPILVKAVQELSKEVNKLKEDLYA
jgi:hypothetical protein